MSESYVGVHLLDAPYAIDHEYTYRVPDGMSVETGGFVSVPFGGGNRHRLALVTSKKNEAPEGTVIKPIFSSNTGGIALTEEMLSLCAFMKAQTLCTVGDAVKSMMPVAALSHLTAFYTPTEKATKKPRPNVTEMMILDHIMSRGRATEDALRARFGPDTGEILAKLLRSGEIAREFEISEYTSKQKTRRVYTSAYTGEQLARIYDGSLEGMRRLTSEAQRNVIAYLIAEVKREYTAAELRELDGVGLPQLKALVTKGILIEKEVPISRDLAYISETADPKPLILSDEQAAALDTLSELSDSGEARAALLYGVTGSGKTSVMLALIDKILAEGRGAIVLLPEIALTPQTLSIFCSRYGQRVAIIHSGLSQGERLDSYLRIREGKADLVIGTRSAVFAPIKDLGLIVIDEEQEHTYKSDMSPRYHTKDIARFRSAYHSSLMLLASATPSIESFERARAGKYTLLELKNRYGSAKLPEVTICDMRAEPRSGNLTPIGGELARKLTETVSRGEQAILFLNRRGYNNFVRCAECGEAIRCERCSVSMTYHTHRGTYDRGELRCHWCGARSPMPEKCPHCGSVHLIRMGFGTQRLEQELRTMLPEARVIRMDTDTTSTKQAYEQLLGIFRRHEADILIGTQMVTKGHDFPDVTLVGVLLADASLYLDDFRAGERTFAMLTQVIGRAGRASKKGEALIQTMNPDHDIIRLARSQDYLAFYEREIKLRRVLAYPPYCDIVLLTLVSEDEHGTLLAATKLSERLRELNASEEYKDVPLIAFGPFEAPVYRVDGRYRMRMVIKCKLNSKSRRLFSELLAEFSRVGGKAPTLSIDFNPTNI